MRAPFIGRETALSDLHALYLRRAPSIAVIKGRRRIGKSRLVTEFAAQHPKARFFSFSALAPQPEFTAQMQRDYFGRQLAHLVGLPPMTFEDWTDAFYHLSIHVKDGDIVLFDEISWMGMQDNTFVSKLKAWWDLQTANILLVMCGSVSTWIQENILNSTAFFGRIALTISLEPLSISESATLLKQLGFKGSALEVYKILAVMGGIPWYLEQINPQLMADDNLKKMCFESDGLLVAEFDKIFHDLFGNTGAIYKKILHALKEGPKTLAELKQALDYANSGTFSQKMEHLKIAGFVQRHYQWALKTGGLRKQYLYRLSDPYIRFYLKMIEPEREQIAQGKFKKVDIARRPGFDGIIGLQLENLLVQNRALLLEAVGVQPGDCQCDGPYRQAQTARHKGCQIDYLIQTIPHNLFVCEFKVTKGTLMAGMISEVEERIKRLAIPRGFAAVPVLFHLGEVASSVYDRNFFYKIINIEDFLG